eukprot:3896072-Rhodomonas_salina.1
MPVLALASTADIQNFVALCCGLYTAVMVAGLLVDQVTMCCLLDCPGPREPTLVTAKCEFPTDVRMPLYPRFHSETPEASTACGQPSLPTNTAKWLLKEGDSRRALPVTSLLR